jgi:hypothetical protein
MHNGGGRLVQLTSGVLGRPWASLGVVTALEVTLYPILYLVDGEAVFDLSRHGYRTRRARKYLDMRLRDQSRLDAVLDITYVCFALFLGHIY